MKNLYFASLAVFALFATSCESEAVDTTFEDSSRTAPISGQSLRINNQSDLTLSGELVCYGANNNMTVNPMIRLVGKITVPANTQVTHINFNQSSNPDLRINPWFVTYNTGPTFTYGATQANDTFGQLLAPGISPVKFANWRYLKVKLSYNEIPGFQPVTMVIELPQHSSNNTGGQLIDLSQYGLEEDLYVSQSSYLAANGNTVLTIESELVN